MRKVCPAFLALVSFFCFILLHRNDFLQKNNDTFIKKLGMMLWMASCLAFHIWRCKPIWQNGSAVVRYSIHSVFCGCPFSGLYGIAWKRDVCPIWEAYLINVGRYRAVERRAAFQQILFFYIFDSFFPDLFDFVGYPYFFKVLFSRGSRES